MKHFKRVRHVAAIVAALSLIGQSSALLIGAPAPPPAPVDGAACENRIDRWTCPSG